MKDRLFAKIFIGSIFLLLVGLVYGQINSLPDRQAIPTPIPSPMPSPSPSVGPISIDEFSRIAREKTGKDFFIFPSPSPEQRIEKRKIIDPEAKERCFVDKNGSFEMTYRECKELSEQLGEEFVYKGYQYCLDGKNPLIGDSGSQKDREQKCLDLFGLEKIN